MAHWLVKTEPGDYSFADLEQAGTARWDGVKNALALKHLSAMRRGDAVFVYHTGLEKAVVGVARAASDPYPDPRSKPGASGPALRVIDLVCEAPLARPVTLAEIKGDPAFEGFALVRLPRLSVMPVPDDLARRIQERARRAKP